MRASASCRIIVHGLALHFLGTAAQIVAAEKAAEPRTLPLAVTRKRFFAPLLVFILGILTSFLS